MNDMEDVEAWLREIERSSRITDWHENQKRLIAIVRLQAMMIHDLREEKGYNLGFEAGQKAERDRVNALYGVLDR